MDEDTPEQNIFPEEIDLPSVQAPRQTIFELATFIARAVAEEARMASIAKQYLDELYDEIGSPDEAATTIISYIQRRHGWDIELLAEKREIEEMLFKRFSRYDESMWEKVLNTDAISDLHHEVYKMSQTYIGYAIDEVLSEEDGDEFEAEDHPEFD